MKKYILRKESYETWIEPDDEPPDEYEHIYPSTAFYKASEADAAIAAKDARISSLCDALHKFGTHGPLCDLWGSAPISEKQCTCGLDSFL